jgi:hypothetical protein
MADVQQKATHRVNRAKRMTERESASGGDTFAKKRAQSMLEIAEANGLLNGGKTRMIRGRMPEQLVALAKARTGISSDTELLEAALATLAVNDNYGAWLITQRGSIPKDIDLEF